MITELYYWIFLCIGLALSTVSNIQFRCIAFTLISVAFLVFAIGSLSPEAEITRFWQFNSPYRVIIDLLLFSVFFYLAPKRLKHKSYWFAVKFFLVAGPLLYLSYYKYLPNMLAYIAGNPLDSGIILPLGVSYFVFRLIHYAIESGRENLPTHNYMEFLTYLFFFPIITAGPIERFEHFKRHWQSDSRRDDLVEGSTRVIYGLIKKFLIVDVLLITLFNNNTADTVVTRVDSIEQYKVWGFLLLTYIKVYLEFSAYSDIAIGSSRILGFRIMENFNWPIIATNIADLWRRWHMTLSGWCQAYIYLPSIGLTRNPYLAAILTFLFVGIWHSGSLNWLFWGLYHGVGICAYILWRRLLQKRKWSPPTGLWIRIPSILITNFWMAGSFAFTATYQNGSWTEIFNAFILLRRYFLMF